MYSAVIGPEPVGAILKRRGFAIAARGKKRDVVLPLWREIPLSGEQIGEFLRLFNKPAFRKLIREVALATDGVSMERLHRIAPHRAHEYVDLLVNLEVVARSEAQVSLEGAINNIGPTLEWYVADVCEREFEGSAEWSVELSGGQYGDYDVLAWLPPSLVYIETKSCRPREVSDSALKHFLQRGIDLAPELAILLIDTEDDLEKTGLLERLFEVMLPTVQLQSGIRDAKWRPERPFIAPQPGYPGVSFGYRRFYVTNSTPSIKRQLERCLGHYNKNVKGQAFVGGEPVNFVTGELEADRR